MIERSDRNLRKRPPRRNLTDGQITLNVDPEDHAEEDDHFSRL
jgi:hypothetical protein